MTFIAALRKPFQQTPSPQLLPSVPETDARPAWARIGLPVAVLVLALVLCIRAGAGLDLRGATDVGILPLLPVTFWVGIGLLTLSFSYLVVHPSSPSWLLAAHVIALIVGFYALSMFASDIPRGNVAWRHMGIVDNLIRSGHPDPSIDAYFSWPGFFALAALITKGAGFSSPSPLALWGPLYTNLAFLGPLVYVLRALTADRRLVWLGVWVFYLTDWVNQDYFSPQSFTYFLYLVILAVVLAFFRGRPFRPRIAPNQPVRSRRAPAFLVALAGRYPRLMALDPKPLSPGVEDVSLDTPPEMTRVRQILRQRLADQDPPRRFSFLTPDSDVFPPRFHRSRRAGLKLLEWTSKEEVVDFGVGVTPRQRARLFLIGAVVLVVIAPTHQLTPFALLTGLGALALAGRLSVPRLALIGVVTTIAWVSFMTASYLSGHMAELLTQVGDVAAAAQENLSDRVSGSSGHQFVVHARLALTIGVWLLAFIGFQRRRRTGRRDVAAVVLVFAPYPLLLLQAYGGEMLLRTYLFSLPFMAFFIAAAIFPNDKAPRRTWVALVSVVVLSGVLLPAITISRYGNSRIEDYTADEIVAVEQLYRVAPRGAILVAAANNAPWRYKDYERYKYRSLTVEWPKSAGVPQLADRLTAQARGNPHGLFLLVGRSQEAYDSLLGGMPRSALTELEARLHVTPGWRVVYRNNDARIYAFMKGPVTP